MTFQQMRNKKYWRLLQGANRLRMAECWTKEKPGKHSVFILMGRKFYVFIFLNNSSNDIGKLMITMDSDRESSTFSSGASILADSSSFSLLSPSLLQHSASASCKSNKCVTLFVINHYFSYITDFIHFLDPRNAMAAITANQEMSGLA